MTFTKVSRHIANNALGTKEINALITDVVHRHAAGRYTKGYMDRMRHEKKHRDARRVRLDGEFGQALDFISDLTHEK